MTVNLQRTQLCPQSSLLGQFKCISRIKHYLQQIPLLLGAIFKVYLLVYASENRPICHLSTEFVHLDPFANSEGGNTRTTTTYKTPIIIPNIKTNQHSISSLVQHVSNK
ncbi:unnamed protein product [Ceutorhynchus assimilis]|uniref:Uncharacterized protein n=1 Tax=Ceutorhynchus assimilis TaxID=467358 RepID=A0A9N9MD39_9CUCU|nr:unnamed protein product [Ceutorhynchus assimilis]